MAFILFLARETEGMVFNKSAASSAAATGTMARTMASSHCTWTVFRPIRSRASVSAALAEGFNLKSFI